jgi:hypothetical protein
MLVRLILNRYNQIKTNKNELSLKAFLELFYEVLKVKEDVTCNRAKLESPDEHNCFNCNLTHEMNFNTLDDFYFYLRDHDRALKILLNILVKYTNIDINLKRVISDIKSGENFGYKLLIVFLEFKILELRTRELLSNGYFLCNQIIEFNNNYKQAFNFFDCISPGLNVPFAYFLNFYCSMRNYHQFKLNCASISNGDFLNETKIQVHKIKDNININYWMSNNFNIYYSNRSKHEEKEFMLSDAKRSKHLMPVIEISNFINNATIID